MKAITLTPRTLILPLVLIGILDASVNTVYAAMDAEQVKRQLENDYGVRVLKVREVVDLDKAAFAVTVMNPPGDFNEAFQVNTVVVDRETGLLIPQTRESANGGVDPAPAVTRRTSPRTVDTP